MKKASIKVQDATNNPTPFEKSCISLNCNNEKQENLNNQVNLNIMKFVKNSLNKKLMKALYQDPQTKSISNEYKNNLIYYYVFLLTYLISLGAFTLLLYNINYLSKFHLEIHMICLSIIIFISILTLILLFKSEKVLLNSRNIFLIITSCLNFYLILADERILHKLTGENLGEKQLPLSLGLICTIVLSRIILFDYFFYIFILGTSTLIMFFSSHLAFSGYSSYSIFSEASLITLLISLQIIECYRADFRIKQIFYRREQEAVEDNSKLIKKDSLPVSGINTEVENILVKCNKIGKNLKHISQIVIYKDIKRLLKKSLTNIDKIKRKVAHGGFETGRVELSPGLDDDDRIYITQNFLGLNSTNNILQQESLSNLSERIISFPFSRYGVNELESILAGVGKNWSFDIFFVYESTGHSISMVSKYLFQKWNFFDSFLYVSKKDSEKGKISEELVTKYFSELENAYFQNFYHNACHASDVLHSMLYFVLNTEIIKNLGPLDLLAVVMASLGHDVGHPALTNRFLVNNRDTLAIQYNDNSVLENMHCSLTFSILNKPGCNFLEDLSNSEWFTLRKLIIEMIMETDMSKHFEILAKFRTRAIVLSDFNISVIEDKCTILAMGLKCADIAHSAKDNDLHVKWSKLVTEEFFAQGDMEKQRKQAVSMYCDREITDVPKSQMGFLKNICLPLYEVWCRYLDTEIINNTTLKCLKNNLAHWESMIKKRKGTVLIPPFPGAAEMNLKRHQSEF